MFKNTAAQKWVVFAFQDEGGATPGEPVTGDAANITANIRIDGGAADAVDDTNPTELEGGYYVFDITATESNGDNLVITPSSSSAFTNVIGVPGALYPTTPMRGTDDALTPTVPGRTLDVTATGEAGLDLDNTSGTLAAAQFAAGFITATKFGAGAIDAAAISTDFTDEVMADWLEGGRLDLLLDAIKVVTDGQGATGTGLTAMPWNAAWDAEVESEVNDALDTAISELGVQAPVASPTIRSGIMLLYMALRNKRLTDADQDDIHNNAGAVICSAVLSDDTLEFIKSEYA